MMERKKIKKTITNTILEKLRSMIIIHYSFFTQYFNSFRKTKQ